MRSMGGATTFVTPEPKCTLEERPNSQKDSADLCVGPEHIALFGHTESGMGREPEQNIIEGVVLDVVALGSDVHVVVELADRSSFC